MFKAGVLALAVAAGSVAVNAQEPPTLYTFGFKVQCGLKPPPAGQQVTLTACGITLPKNEAGEKNTNAASFGFAGADDDDDSGGPTQKVFEVTVPMRTTTTAAPTPPPTTAAPTTPAAATTTNATGTIGPSPAAAALAAAQAASAAGGTPVTFSQLNSIDGVSGAKAGVEYSAALQAARSTFASPAAATAAEIQAVVTKANAAAAAAATTTAAPTAAPTPAPRTATTPCDICNIPDDCSCVREESGAWWQPQADGSLLALFASNCPPSRIPKCSPTGSVAPVGQVTTAKVDTAVSGGCIFGKKVDQCTCSAVGILRQSAEVTVNATLCVTANEPTINITTVTPPDDKCKDDDYVIIIIIIIAVILIFVTCTSLYFCCKSEKGEKLSTK